MSSQCRGICHEYAIKIPNNEKYYENGRIFCRQCELFMIIPSIRCPCCKASVRNKPRSKKKIIH